MKTEILENMIYLLEDKNQFTTAGWYTTQIDNQFRDLQLHHTGPAPICQDYSYRGHHIVINADAVDIFNSTGKLIYSDTPPADDLPFFSEMLIEADLDQWGWV